MQIEKFIQIEIADFFSPTFLSVSNESHKHRSTNQKLAETHFKLVIVSNKFLDKKQIERHRLVYKALEGIFSQGVHSLEIHTFTQAEWHAKKHIVPKSPACLGGSTSK